MIPRIKITVIGASKLIKLSSAEDCFSKMDRDRAQGQNM